MTRTLRRRLRRVLPPALLAPVAVLPVAVLLCAALPRLNPFPPGRLLTTASAILPGNAGAYLVTLSRQTRGTHGQFQYFLSIYAAWQMPPKGAKAGQQPKVPWHRVFVSPGDGQRIVPRVTKGHGTDRYFPEQSVRLVGAVKFEPDRPALVLAQERNTGADCGMGRIAILGPLGDKRFGPVATIDNPCGISAKVERKTIGHAEVVLTGPYYAKDAPLYTPTITKARAVLKMQGGKFLETPEYFPIKLLAKPEN